MTGEEDCQFHAVSKMYVCDTNGHLALHSELVAGFTRRREKDMKKEKKTKWVHVRLTEKEEKALNEKFRKSTCNQLSQYARKVLLGQPIVVKYRNESLDCFMEEIILCRQELNAIGNNFNQAVKKLHSLKQIPEFRTWLHQNEILQVQIRSKTDHIKERISKMSEKWLQE